MDNLIVKAENLVKIYQSGKVRVKALDGVNLIARRGEILSIIGPSGSGKTTLLNIIGGLDKPTKGTVFIDNTEITKLSEEELVKFRLRNIGFVFQYFNLIPSLSVVENVELPLALLGVSRIERRELASTTLRELGLIHRANFNPSELSGGMKQRVNIARALAIEPDVLLMDKPFSNLDPLTAESLRSEVLDIWLSSILPVKSIIMVTHNVEEAV
ncbi:MAG: ABC transporter ATP-binding protein, partial [Desulfurococcaceae archaeon]